MNDEYQTGYDPENPPAQTDDWMNDPGWFEFADGMVRAVRDEPDLIEAWYDEFAEQQGLRRLAEAVVEEAVADGQVTAKFGSSEFTEQVRQAMRDAREKVTPRDD